MTSGIVDSEWRHAPATVRTYARGAFRQVGRATIALTFALAPAGHAATVAADAALFGAREEVQQASLSPDGSHLVAVQPLGGRGTGVFVADLTGSGKIALKRITTVTGNPERIAWCRWAGNTRVVCLAYAASRPDDGGVVYVSRLFAMDRDGTNQVMVPMPRGSGDRTNYALFGGAVIDWSPSEAGHILVMREYVPENSLGTRAAQTREGVGVDDLNVVTLKTHSVEPPRPSTWEYITDGQGSVRIIGTRLMVGDDGYETGAVRYSFRKLGSRDWQPLSLARSGEGFEPYGFDAATDSVIGLKKLDGRIAAYRKALDGTGTEALLFTSAEVDVEEFLHLGPHNRIVGASYVTDKRQAKYFDPALERLAAALAKAMPERPLIRFVDANDDETVLLIWAGSDVDPGRYYLYSRTTHHLDELIVDRPQLADRPLARVEAVRYPAADGTAIPAYLTLPPDGRSTGKALVLPHGGPGARDEWGFDWLAQFYAAQGYAVLQPNFRGSTGYGEAWLQRNGFRNWRTAIGDVTDAGRWLIARKLAAPGRLGIVGWSYGGYAALQSAVVAPGLFRAVVAIAPVTDFSRLKDESRYWSNYWVVSDYVGSGKDVDEGSPARHADKMTAPVLLFHGDMDRNVAIAESVLMDQRLRTAGKASQLVTYKGLDHYLDDSGARTDLLTRSIGFLDASLSAP